MVGEDVTEQIEQTDGVGGSGGVPRGEVEPEREVSLDESMETMACQCFDAIHGVPVVAQTAMALRAFGLSNSQIAKRLGYADSSGVRKLLDRHDPDKISERGDALRRLVLSCMFERIAFEALSGIKKSELDELSVKDRISVSKDAIRAMSDLQAKVIRMDDSEKKLLDDLKAYANGIGITEPTKTIETTATEVDQ